MLKDETGKTAVFFGDTPGETEDQFSHTQLVPVGDLTGRTFQNMDIQLQVFFDQANGYQNASTRTPGGGLPADPAGNGRAVSACGGVLACGRMGVAAAIRSLENLFCERMGKPRHSGRRRNEPLK